MKMIEKSVSNNKKVLNLGFVSTFKDANTWRNQGESSNIQACQGPCQCDGGGCQGPCQYCDSGGCQGPCQTWDSITKDVVKPDLQFKIRIAEKLRIVFFRERHTSKLLSAFMKCWHECLEDVVRTVKRKELRTSCIVVVKTHGRSGHYNPHLIDQTKICGNQWDSTNALPIFLTNNH